MKRMKPFWCLLLRFCRVSCGLYRIFASFLAVPGLCSGRPGFISSKMQKVVIESV